mmetsp:Transcript_30869/g.96116  ORF Transcript_30869/g.96116 Transcript_30869/m.96116 type:complete len:228 (+) Transcript_30869:94-777(+)
MGRPAVLEWAGAHVADSWPPDAHGAAAAHGADGLGSPIGKLRWVEQARHAVLLLRLQRPYLLYCLMCSLLSSAAFLSTLADLLDSHRRGQLAQGRSWEDVLEGGSWQSACWTVVALALCAEVLSSAVLKRGMGCAADWWGAFDAAVVALTFCSWALMRLRRASPMREEAEEADLWLLALRFASQPCRVFAAAKMAHKVQQMQQNHVDISFDSLEGPQPWAGHGLPGP